MATAVSICSAALLKLGDAPLATLTENTKRALLCANVYPLAKQDVLRGHPWNCCIKRVLLSPLVDAPPFTWRYQHPLPGDCLRVLQVGYDGHLLDYQLEGKRILARTDVVPLVYVADAEEGAWDAKLVHVMIARMEADLAYPITKSTSLAEAKATAYAQILRNAKSIDGQENPPEEWNDSPFIQVRGGSPGYLGQGV